jgi:hypothetical protein
MQSERRQKKTFSSEVLFPRRFLTRIGLTEIEGFDPKLTVSEKSIESLAYLASIPFILFRKLVVLMLSRML